MLQSSVLARALSTAALLAGASACQAHCEDLQRICDECVDPFQRASCEELVDREDADLCLEGGDVFTNVCG